MVDCVGRVHGMRRTIAGCRDELITRCQSQELVSFYFIPAFAVLAILSGIGLTILGGILTKPAKVSAR